jgi:hypothetical protein
MDYARFNYVAQPEDGIPESGFFPRIGEYDIWAIEWGYRWVPEEKTPEDDAAALNKLTSAKLKDSRYRFGTETDPDDPRNQSEDIGDNAVKASTYGIMNLKRIIVKLPEWTREPNKDYGNLTQLYSQLLDQFSRYMGHVTRNIGGIYHTPKKVEDPGVVVEFVPKARQKEAMRFIQEQLFTTPTWLVDNNITSYTGNNRLAIILSIQSSALNRLISNATFSKLLRFEEHSKGAYTAHEMMTDLRKGIWSELAGRTQIDIYRRALQKAFVENLGRFINPDATPGFQITPVGVTLSTPVSKTSDAISIAKAQLRTLASEIRAALPAYGEGASRAHLQDVLDRIGHALERK